ncbi:hypothetical protein IAU60_004208 [Kwoniella sp. DSM 27419]
MPQAEVRVWTGAPIQIEEAFAQVREDDKIDPSWYRLGPAMEAAECLIALRTGTDSPSDRGSSDRPLTADSTESEPVNHVAGPSKKRKQSTTSDASGDGQKAKKESWSARREFCYLMCVLNIPPIGRPHIMLFGKMCGRNEVIAKILTIYTGKLGDRKVISSHSQVLRARSGVIKKPLRDLLTTSEKKKQPNGSANCNGRLEDEEPPVTYTLPADWNYPVCINRIMGFADHVDLRVAPCPPIIYDLFERPAQEQKAMRDAQKARDSAREGYKAKSRAKTKHAQYPHLSTPSSAPPKASALYGQPSQFGMTPSPSGSTHTDGFDFRPRHGSSLDVRLDNPSSYHSPVYGNAPPAHNPYAPAHYGDRRLAYPSPRDTSSPGLGIDFGETAPRRITTSHHAYHGQVDPADGSYLHSHRPSVGRSHSDFQIASRDHRRPALAPIHARSDDSAHASSTPYARPTPPGYIDQYRTPSRSNSQAPVSVKIASILTPESTDSPGGLYQPRDPPESAVTASRKRKMDHDFRFDSYTSFDQESTKDIARPYERVSGVSVEMLKRREYGLS